MTLRVIHDPPQDGPCNMASDEVLLDRVGQGISPPTLRFYQWDPPTISLGYFQKYADYEQLPPPAGELAVVRRLTGGGAILHDQELTYSLALPLGHLLLEGGPNQLYELAHDVVITCLGVDGTEAWRGCQTDDSTASRGPFFCFDRRHCFDVLIGQDKLAGSAQRRTKLAVLQHGSIMLDRRFAQQPTATVQTQADALAKLFTETLSQKANIPTESSQWTAQEQAAMAAGRQKYTGTEWLRRS